MGKSLTGDDLFHRMMKRLGKSYQSFLFYKAFTYRRNSDLYPLNIIERNNFVVNRHQDFFASASIGFLTTSIIDLYTFFDKSNNNIKYKDLLNELKPMLHSSKYEKISNEVDAIIRSIEPLLDNLTAYRNSELAHEGKNRKEFLLLITDIETLFQESQKIFNLIGTQLYNCHVDFSLTNFEDISNDLDAVFNELFLGYKEFEKEVHKMYFPD